MMLKMRARGDARVQALAREPCADEETLKVVPMISDIEGVVAARRIMLTTFEPRARRSTARSPRETIVLRPAEVDRAWHDFLATYPTLRRTWRGGGVWAEVDAMAEFYEGMQRIFGI
jgi:hypothetical protein